MKFIKTDEITNEVGVFITKKYHDFVSDLKKYETSEIVYQTTNCVDSPNNVWQYAYLNFQNPSGSNWTWQDGSVFYQSKLYPVSIGSLTLGLGEFLVYYFIDTPINETFSDGTSKPFLIERTVGICKNTENVSQQIQAVDILKYCNLDKTETVGLLNYKLVKRGNVWTLTGHGQLPASSIVLLKNYRGQNYESGLIVSFPFYIFEIGVTPFIIRGDLSKNINNDLVFSFSNTSQIQTNFSISWVE